MVDPVAPAAGLAGEPPRILVITAHGADFCSRGGGTLAKYVRAGSPVRIVALTLGERGESAAFWKAHPDATIEEAKQTRRREAEAAAAIVGAEIRFLDWDDYPLYVAKERLLAVTDQIREARPDILLTHWSGDPFNQDHEVASATAIRACSVAAAAGQRLAHPPARYPKVFLLEPSVPLTEFEGFNPDTYVDISETFEQKLRALREFHSQPDLPDNYTLYARKRALQARALSGNPRIEYAEAFKRYRPRVAEWLD
jgi:4-oxalomesaconate hydratase